jgi:uncharacterized protein DUF6627
MFNNIRYFLMYVLAAATLGMGVHVAPAGAGVIATDEAVPQLSDRERLKALVARPEVAKKLETLGVLPKDAAARIDALTDDEVSTLASRIDALPAGAMTDQNWLLVIIIILLVVILAAA